MKKAEWISNIPQGPFREKYHSLTCLDQMLYFQGLSLFGLTRFDSVNGPNAFAEKQSVANLAA